MTILQFIDRTLLEPIDTKRFRSLRTILADFPEGDVDILLTAVPGWAGRFVDFLAKYPNRLRKGTTLSDTNQRLYLLTLRKLLRKAVTQGLYPDLDPILPYIKEDDKNRRGPRQPEGGIPDHQAELAHLCTLHLTGEADTLRRLYYISLLAGGLEIPQLLTLQVITEGARHTVTTPDGTPLRHSDAILSLAAPRKEKSPKEAKKKSEAASFTGSGFSRKESPEVLPESRKHLDSGAIAMSASAKVASRPDSGAIAMSAPSTATHKSLLLDESQREILTTRRSRFLSPGLSISEAIPGTLPADIRLHPGSIFTDLICMAARTLPAEAVTAAIATRLLTPEKYFADLPRYQTLFHGTFNDGGALVPRWFALRSVNPRKSGQDLSQAITADPSLSTLITDTYLPTDSIVIERKGRRITRNHPAVNKLLFVKTVTGSISQILRTVDDVTAYRRGRTNTYATIPYAEIYRMRLVLGAVGSDPNTDILTDEELHTHFSTEQLSLGDLVTVSRPGYEQFTAKVIKRKGHDSYCVTFPDLSINIVMTDIPRALITKL